MNKTKIILYAASFLAFISIIIFFVFENRSLEKQILELEQDNNLTYARIQALANENYENSSSDYEQYFDSLPVHMDYNYVAELLTVLEAKHGFVSDKSLNSSSVSEDNQNVSYYSVTCSYDFSSKKLEDFHEYILDLSEIKRILSLEEFSIIMNSEVETEDGKDYDVSSYNATLIFNFYYYNE